MRVFRDCAALSLNLHINSFFRAVVTMQFILIYANVSVLKVTVTPVKKSSCVVINELLMGCLSD